MKGDVENVAPHYIVNAMTTKCCRLVAWQWAMASKNGAEGEWTGRNGRGQSKVQANKMHCQGGAKEFLEFIEF